MKKITIAEAVVRDAFIKINAIGKYGADVPADKYDIFHFEGLSAKDLKRCIAKGWADPKDCQNSAPSIGDILEFLVANPSFKAHGYVVTPHRDDTRISIEGVIAEGAPRAEVDAYIEMFRQADEFEFDSNGGYCRAWYD
jgi:hypothetical protein